MQSKATLSGNSANLDLIRAVAVLCVFFAHLNDLYFAYHGAPGYLETLTWHFGQMGILIFFVHTSLVLLLSLERSHSRGRKFFTDFYIRRFFRIYPLSMFCVTAGFLAVPRAYTWIEYLSNITLTTDLFYIRNIVGVMWTLVIEVQMYLVLPFLFLFARGRPLWALGGVWVIALIAGILVPQFTGRLEVLLFAPCFIPGVMAWRLSRSTRRVVSGWLWPLAFVALWPIFFIDSERSGMYLHWAFCLALGLAIPLFQEMPFAPLRKAVHVVAKYSYGIYLSHTTIMTVIFATPMPAATQFAAIAVGTAVVPFLMYHLIEHPMILFGQWLVCEPQGFLVGESPHPTAAHPEQVPTTIVLRQP
jgi:peptidoglycan/LPS O-acetylase OafA/YrhL